MSTSTPEPERPSAEPVLPVHEVPAQQPPRCPNCGEPAPGLYCAHCGQRQGRLRLTVGELLQESSRYLLRVDSRWLRTVWQLLRPGRLTLEYLQGRRESYERPLRLLFVLSLFFVLLATLAPQPALPPELIQQVRAQQERELKAGQASSPLATSPTPPDSPLERLAQQLRDSRQRDIEEVLNRYLTLTTRYVTKSLILLIPLLAAFLRLLHLRRDFLYSEHFVFYLHCQCFSLLVSWPQLLFINAPVVALSLGSYWLYLLLAMRRVYRVGWVGTLWRWGLLCLAELFFQSVLGTALYFYAQLAP